VASFWVLLVILIAVNEVGGSSGGDPDCSFLSSPMRQTHGRRKVTNFNGSPQLASAARRRRPPTSDPRMTGKGTDGLHSRGSFLSQFGLESSFRRCTLDGNLRE
jgi:hypothetical protein